MIWIGKAVGGAFGLVIAGPIGLALGTLLGHQFDRGAAQLSTEGSIRFRSGQIPEFFFNSTFAVMGHVAKSDGRVSEKEIRAARGIMHSMNLSSDQVNIAIKHFTSGKSASYRLDEQLNQLSGALRGRNDLRRAFVEIQMQALVFAGSIEIEKRETLWRIAKELDIGRVELAQIEALVRTQHNQVKGIDHHMASIEHAYKVLGLDLDATDKDVKTAYRRLMNQHHPDKLVARGMPESMIIVSKDKTHKIRAAYELIKSQRNFK
ncbi:MAG: co-chaperone DjlA [Rhodospirillaceae bacterium]|nr:co-chaperone DjlA [Rhodospirillaceae bacterium]|tara:strand:- start:2025 stop:2813 length:789 start_codon:yes stop_codon:yes gene_type:complete